MRLNRYIHPHSRLIATRGSLEFAQQTFCPISARDETMKKKKCYVTSTEGNLSANGYTVIQHVILYRHLFDIIVSLQMMKIQRCVANRRCQFIRFAMTNQELSRLLLVLHESILHCKETMRKLFLSKCSLKIIQRARNRYCYYTILYFLV